ncbi:MAG: FAD-dependent oxidoreductase [Actinomycetota bacterium]|nr:FAD-dependent oxidoreductase [Actinomycetota bacterium]
MAETSDAEVVVIGAGLSGRTAARVLARAGREVVVLEARDRVGGRVVGVPVGDGGVAELGGAFVGAGQERIGAAISELGLQTFPSYNEGKRVLELGPRLRRFGFIPKISPVVLADLVRAVALAETSARQVSVNRPWEARSAPRLDAETFETWIRHNLWTEDGRRLFRAALVTIFAAEPHTFSTLWALSNFRSGGGLLRMLRVRDGAHQDRIVGGVQRLAERSAESLGDRVRLSTPARRIVRTGDGGVRVEADSLTVRAQRAIIALPPTLAGRLTYDPPLPTRRDHLTQRMPHGAVVKFAAVYDEAFWRQQGLNGQAASDVSPVTLTFDGSPAGGGPGILVGYVRGRHAVELGEAGLAQRRAAVLDCLRRFFGRRAAAPVDYLDLDWSAEEWTRGCYGGNAAPGTLTRFGPALRTPVGPLHWAGSETAHEWVGYMDGAIEAGERAAKETMDVLSEGSEDFYKSYLD